MERRASRTSPNIFRANSNLIISSQDLALEARDIWLEWNRAIKETPASDLPTPLSPEDELLTLCGVYHMADGPEMIDRYVENLRVMADTAPSFRDLQFIKVRRREREGLGSFRLMLTSDSRIAPRMNNGLGPWAPNGKRSIICLTSLGVVAPMDFWMQVPGSLSRTRYVWSIPSVSAIAS